jgi:hypothetical protein
MASITFSTLTGEDENQAVVVVVDPALTAKVQSGALFLWTRQGSRRPATFRLWRHGRGLKGVMVELPPVNVDVPYVLERRSAARWEIGSARTPTHTAIVTNGTTGRRRRHR